MGRGRCGQHPPPACWAVPGRGLRPGFGSWPLRSSRVWGTLGSWDHRGPERPGWDTSKGREDSDRHRPAGGVHHTPREKGGCREGGNEGGDVQRAGEVSAKETWTEQKAERERQGVKEGVSDCEGPGGHWLGRLRWHRAPCCAHCRRSRVRVSQQETPQRLSDARVPFGNGQRWTARAPLPGCRGAGGGVGLRSVPGCRLVPMPLFLSRVTAAERRGASLGVSSQPCARLFPDDGAATGFRGRVNWGSSQQGGDPPGPPALGLAALWVVWGPPARLRSAAGQRSGSVLPLGQQGCTAQGPL